MAILAGVSLCCTALAVAQLRVGVGKVDVTPDAGKLPEPMIGVHDPVFTRAILMENGGSFALFVNIDAGGFPTPFAKAIQSELTSRYGIPPENMIFSGTHDHSSGHLLDPAKPTTDAASKAFTGKVYQGILDAVKQAKSTLQPAEMGYGEGRLYLNVNRNGLNRKTMQWEQTPNADGPSDKTLAVLLFRKPNGGEPIAFYMNYAMHGITMYLTGLISGDFPGIAQSYIEDLYDNKVVAMWTQGAEGDQNPLYLRAISKITEQRIRDEMDPAKVNDADERNQANVRLYKGALKRPLQPLDPKLVPQAWRVAQAEGTLMAEETLRVAGQITHYSSNAVIQGALQQLSCPSRHRARGTSEAEAELVQLPFAIGALRVGDVAFGQVHAEPYNKIGQEIKQGSPFRQTIVVAVASGGPEGGYIPTDDAFHGTSGLQPGCAETSIVNGIDEMLYRTLAIKK